jgi:hypothetical protein
MRGFDIQRLGAAEEIARIEIAADEIGIGHRRSRTATAVARRAWIRPGALRSDSENATSVDPGDRAAARGNRHHVERRDIDLAPGDHRFGHFQRRAAFDAGDVGAGAAHVERDQADPRIFAGEIGARLRARGRT